MIVEGHIELTYSYILYDRLLSALTRVHNIKREVEYLT